jgi:glutamine cyclotransferase
MKKREVIYLVIILGFIAIYVYDNYYTTPTLEPLYSYQVVNKYDHDPDAFTQGLVFYNGFFYEGTGLRGKSSLRMVDPETGEIIKSVNLDPTYFGEGITIQDDYIYQVTWQEKTGFIYDLDLNQVGTWSIPGEGWGLATNGTHLILSDGTSTLSFIETDTLKVMETITVTSNGEEVFRINELEFIEGFIYANIWQTDRIAIIDPVKGEVTSWIDLTGLENELDSSVDIDVLNGIAYDNETERLYVTGKLWPNLFEIALIAK